MTDKEFDTNLLRFIAAETYVSVLIQISRELFGKSYFSLSQTEQNVVHQTANNTIGANYRGVTPQFLGQHPKNPLGFEAPKGSKDPEAEKK